MQLLGSRVGIEPKPLGSSATLCLLSYEVITSKQLRQYSPVYTTNQVGNSGIFRSIHIVCYIVYTVNPLPASTSELNRMSDAPESQRRSLDSKTRTK